MATVRQLQANRRNALLSTGPRTARGKSRSRRNALKHGLTAETLIAPLEDLREYAHFEIGLRREIKPKSVLERGLTERLASLLWRLRRATIIEAGLLRIHARMAEEAKLIQEHGGISESRNSFQQISSSLLHLHPEPSNPQNAEERVCDIAICFLRFCNTNNAVASNLPRYEARLWKEAREILRLIHPRWASIQR